MNMITTVLWYFLFYSPVTRTGNCFEITLELSCCKYPASSSLKTEWDNNKESMLKYTEEIHKGIKGFVKDEEGKSIVGKNFSSALRLTAKMRGSETSL